jgi:5-oxoprolinase (ATP-hydrolysing) subunit C
VSDGKLRGSLQVPANGQPLLMMADGPPTGGYPKIAVVASADQHLLAQCSPGTGRARFRETSLASAQARYRELIGRLRAALAADSWNDDLGAW